MKWNYFDRPTTKKDNLSIKTYSHRYTFTDIESPEVVQCDGPVKDDNGFIFSEEDEAFVNWTIRNI